MDYETWVNFGPEEDECERDEKCACYKCNGEREDDSDIDINDKPRECKNEPWTGA